MGSLRDKSEAYFDDAQEVLVDGYSRPLVRKPYPFFIDHGEGCWVWDVDGNKRIDFTNNFTALIHGHSHPAIVDAICQQTRKSLCSHFPSRHEAVLARELVKRIPSVEKVRFWNTGTEAVMLAVKIARAVTGRPNVAKPEGSYHGQYDLIELSTEPGPDQWGSEAAPNTVARLRGTPAGLLGSLIVFPNNDTESTRELLRRHAGELAAVMIDLVQVHLGYGKPSPAFLQMLREECTKNGILLIFDEIVSLRDGYGGCQSNIGIIPDLTVMGKLIGGGLPVAAVGGRDDLMSVFKVSGDGPRILHSGTFTANPLALAAGVESLRLLPEPVFERLRTLTARLCEGINKELKAANLPGRIEQYCTGCAKLMLSDSVIGNWRDLHRYFFDEKAASQISKLQNLLLDEGVCAARLSFILSTPMTNDDIDFAIEAAGRALRKYSST